MASENLRGVRPAYARFLLLLLGEAVAGAILYAVFTFTPTAVQIVIALIGWVAIANDNMFPKRTRSIGSLLCGITAISAVSCCVAWRMTHQDVWFRLMLTGACLMAALIFLDRRADA